MVSTWVWTILLFFSISSFSSRPKMLSAVKKCAGVSTAPLAHRSPQWATLESSGTHQWDRACWRKATPRRSRRPLDAPLFILSKPCARPAHCSERLQLCHVPSSLYSCPEGKQNPLHPSIQVNVIGENNAYKHRWLGRVVSECRIVTNKKEDGAAEMISFWSLGTKPVPAPVLYFCQCWGSRPAPSMAARQGKNAVRSKNPVHMEYPVLAYQYIDCTP